MGDVSTDICAEGRETHELQVYYESGVNLMDGNYIGFCPYCGFSVTLPATYIEELFDNGR